MNTTKMRHALKWLFPVLIMGVILSFFIVETLVRKDLPYWKILIPLVYIWIWILLSLDVRNKDLIDDISTEFPPKSRQLAQSSLKSGKFSYGIMCIFAPIFTLLANSSRYSYGTFDDSILISYFLYLVVTIPIFLLSLSSWITAGRAFQIIKKDDGEIDNRIKEMAKRGAVLGVLGIGLHIITAIMLGFWVFFL